MDSAYSRCGPGGLYEVLDDLAGLRKIEDSGADEEFEGIEPSAFSVGFEERALRRIREWEVPPRSRSFARRVAAVLPFVIPLLLLAASPLLFVKWSGRNSTEELDFEVALTTVSDQGEDIVIRHSAFIDIAIKIRIGIGLVRRCAKEEPGFVPTANRVLGYLGELCANPATANESRPFPVGRLKAVFDTLSSPATASPIELSSAARDFMDLAESGIAVMYWARTLSPKFERDFKAQLGKIQKRFTSELR